MDDGFPTFSDLECFCIMEYKGAARWRSWLRHYATNRQVAGSIPDGVNGIFQ